MRTKVLLLSKLEKLGEPGDIVQVNYGYARNYLVPYGKANLATPENIEAFKLRKEEWEKIEADKLQQAEQCKQKVDGLDLTVKVKLSDKGTWFGSVGAAEIIAAIKDSCGEELKKNEVHLPNGALRELGEHDIALRLHPDIGTSVKLNLVAEED
jgi:large subunit ribosomal protein L9